jgi:quercetin dioxygenase-like cupin family protein
MTIISEIGVLLSGIAAMLGGSLALIRFWHTRTENRLKKLCETTMANSMRSILRAIEVQTNKLIDGVPKDEIYSFDVRLKSGDVLFVPLLLRTWVQYLPGMSVMLIKQGKHETEFLMEVESPAFLPWHAHTEAESVTVIRGHMIDLRTGTRYHEGDTWDIPAEEFHRAQFDAGTLLRIVCKPPLLNAIERPIDLSPIHKSFDFEEDEP